MASGDAEKFSCGSSWRIAGGSLRDAVCLDSSSESIAQDAVSAAGGVLLRKPAGGDSDPCEITVIFRERHEIRRVYVRSSARVYELYYSFDDKSGDDEYLCTVRCGSTEKPVDLPRVDNGEECLKNSTASTEVSGKSTSSSGEEDGWVEIKSPESPLIKVYHEATAEISDLNPCMSLKIRLLSLQSKEWIHIEEIYIYADPVELEEQSPPLNQEKNIAAHPLLPMIVPALLPFSKPMRDQNHGKKSTERTEQNQENKNSAKDYENKMDELILRVGKMEAFLSRFEESILKPISSIDMRLQRVEEQLDAISSTPQFFKPQCENRISDLRPPGCSDESVPVSCYNNNNKDDDEQDESLDCTEVANECVKLNDDSPGLIIKAPEFLNEEDDTASSGVPSVQEKVHISIDDALTSALKAFMLSGHRSSRENDMECESQTKVLQEGNDNPVGDEKFLIAVTNNEGEIFDATNEMNNIDSPSMSDVSHVQQDVGSSFSRKAANEEDFSDGQEINCQFKMFQDCNDLREEGPRDLGVFRELNSAGDDEIVRCAENGTKMEARDTLKALLDSVLVPDDRPVLRACEDESILEVKFSRNVEPEDVFLLEPMNLDPANNNICPDDHGIGVDSESSEFVFCDKGDGFLIDVEAALEVATEESQSWSPLSSLI
ncbi:40S ribosomal protein S27 [Wolffia australiana]